MARPNAKQREFVSGQVGLTLRQEVHPTQFEQLLDRLALTETNCHENSEIVSWVKEHKDTRYIPERVLARLHVLTIYDDSAVQMEDYATSH